MQYIEHYRDIKTKPTVRELARSLALTGLSLKARLTGNIARELSRPRVQFIYIHHIFRDEETSFRKLIETLLQHHTAISYSEAVNRLLTARVDKPYVVFSSDDGFRNNLRAAAILNDYKISACFFINPAIIGEWNFEKVKDFCAERLHLPPVEFMTWEEVNQLQKEGHEIGSHTMQHINVAATPPDLLHEELQQSFNLIKEYCGSADHFAYPYGRYFHFNEESRRLVFELGYLSCASAERGCHLNPPAPMEKEELFIRRDHILLHWSHEHILYFLVNNIQKASLDNNHSPYPAIR